jgi:hypothetical protein
VNRYHGMPDNPYYYPADDEEAIRLDEIQFVIRTIFHGNILAPILRKPTQILDLGTGSGVQFYSFSEERSLGDRGRRFISNCSGDWDGSKPDTTPHDSSKLRIRRGGFDSGHDRF